MGVPRKQTAKQLGIERLTVEMPEVVHRDLGKHATRTGKTKRQVMLQALYDAGVLSKWSERKLGDVIELHPDVKLAENA